MQNLLVFRVLAAVLGAFFLLQALGWLFDPAQAAEGLLMPLLDGAARSTQIGDIGGFFFALSGAILLGAWTLNATWLYAGALMLGEAAFMRIVAALVHGADFATQFIGVEIVVAALLVLCATRIKALSAA